MNLRLAGNHKDYRGVYAKIVCKKFTDSFCEQVGVGLAENAFVKVGGKLEIFQMIYKIAVCGENIIAEDIDFSRLLFPDAVKFANQLAIFCISAIIQTGTS
jgi:hypothetical protein